MRTLQKPKDSVEDVLKECISNIRDNNFKNRLYACKESIVLSTYEFEKKANIHRVYEIKPSDDVNGCVSSKEMCKIYNEKMVKKSAPGRKYYDKYKLAPRNGICPLCGQRTVSTLDHYLPKTKYPALAISPPNLIPACQDCNKVKSDIEFKNTEEETIHPYFDNVENEIWLYADIIKEDPLAFRFYIKKPKEWDEILYKRVKNHFQVFNLQKLYSAHAAEEFINIDKLLKKIFQKAGIKGLKEHIKDTIDSISEVYLNSWKIAMYREIYNNNWFYDIWITGKV